MKPNPKSVRLWGWKDEMGQVILQTTSSSAIYHAKHLGGTYLGEYIARPVKKKPAKKKGARR